MTCKLGFFRQLTVLSVVKSIVGQTLEGVCVLLSTGGSLLSVFHRWIMPLFFFAERFFFSFAVALDSERVHAHRKLVHLHLLGMKEFDS